MNPRRADRLMEDARFSLAQILERERSGEMVSFDLATKLSFHGEFMEREFVGRNVAALLPGSDPKLRSTAVLLSAHYDTVSERPAELAPGINDNGSGTAALIELARQIGESGFTPINKIT